jgi:DNA-directed RNA polymerase subunit K/omega
MDKIKKHRLSTTNSFIETQNVNDFANRTGNMYESLVIIAKRSDQISKELKEELHSKLEEFASTTDNLEEVFENREQIEISRFYERLPHPTLLSTKEFQEDAIYWRSPEEEEIQPNAEK